MIDKYLRRAVRRMRRLVARPVSGLRDGDIGPSTGTLADVDTSHEFGRLVATHDGRLLHKWTHYLSAYSDQFERFRGRPVRLLEIGVSHGGSLELWRRYFGPQATIFGIDIDPRCAELNGVGGQVRIGSQSDARFLADVVGEMGGVDIVIDDASHVARDQVASFRTLFPMLSVGGMYVVEDLCTSYWRSYGGGHRRAGTFIEEVKNIIDDMNHWYHRQPRSATSIDVEVHSVLLFNSLAFVTRGEPQPPMHVRIGTPSW